MGLIKELGLLPVAPLRFTLWVADKVTEEVDRGQSSPEAQMQRLREIEEEHERGKLTEERAAEAQAEIIQQQVVQGTPTDGQQGDTERG